MSFLQAKTGMLLAVALLGVLLILPFDTGSGAAPARGCGNGLACNTITDSCTIPAGAVTCGKTTTWSTPLPFAPCASCGSVIIKVAGGTAVPLVTTDTKDFVDSSGDSGTAGVWNNMPAAITEIFADQNHRVVADWSAATAYTFAIFCAGASLGATAQLKVQWSVNSGVTWTDLTNSQIAITVGSGNCNGNPVETIEYQSIDFTARIHSVNLRVVGSGGAGAGDFPTITKAYIGYQTSQTIFFVAVPRIQANLADHVTVNIDINVQQTGSLTVTYGVTAWDCSTVSALAPC